MKRVLTFLLAICIGYMANAQIQTKFWGLELSKRYTSLTAAKGIISDRCASAKIVGNAIEARDGTLGGYDWDTVGFYFYDDGTHQALYSVGFASDHEHLQSAKDKYQKLLDTLTSKYGEGIPLNEGIESKGWIDDDMRYLCTLSMHKSIGEEGTAWFVVLVYNDQDLVSDRQKQQEDEL